MPRDTPRVAITGIGIVSAAGSTEHAFWTNLLDAQGVARYVENVDVSDASIRIGCEVTDFDPLSLMSAKEAKRADRVTQFTLGAVDAALASAALTGLDPARVGVVIGTGFGGLRTAEDGAREFLGVNHPTMKGRINPLFVPMVMPNAGAAAVSMRFDFRGPCMTISTACAAGANAIGEAARLIREGSADVVIAGGSEAPLTPWVMTAFAAAHALSERSDDPAGASRPFDRDRDGFVMGEGAAVVVLERLDDAHARDATIRAELLGYGRNADAHHMTSPLPDGRGAAACIELALVDADLGPGDVAHVNAHGTSTPFNDVAEARAIRSVFGDAPPPVTSAKGVLGHAIGAAGAIEVAASILTLESGSIPPTANCVNLDPEVDLDIVRETRDLPEGVVVSNSFAFGGHNAVRVLGRP